MATKKTNPVREYLATIGRKGGKNGSASDKSKAGKIGASKRWAQTTTTTPR